MSGKPSSRGKRTRSAKPPVPVPITVEAVRDWIAILYGKTIETARGTEGALSASFLRFLLQSGEMLLRPDFLADYNHELAKHPQLANGLQPTADMGRELITKWNVDEILLPAHRTNASFAVPLFAPPAESSAGRRPANTQTLRTRLDWAALSWHTQYLLMCIRCYTPQGPRNTLGTPRAKVPSIGRQIEMILGPSRTIPVPQPRGLPRQPGIFVQDEVWGYMTPNIGPGDYGRRRPKPLNQSLAALLDAVTGISGYLPALPQSLQDDLLDANLERLRPVAAVLKQLRCVRCGLLNVIRYLPRIMMPIDLDVSPDAHADRARRRTARLHRARTFVLKRRALSEVLWLPPMHDPGELLETSKGLFNLLDRAGAKPLTEIAAYWRVAIWAQMVALRKHHGRSGGHWEVLLPKIEASVGSNLKAPWSEVEARLRNLPMCVADLGRSDEAQERALRLLDVLLTPEYQAARDALRRYCEIHIYPAAQKHQRHTRESH